jgi:hypothetical protein
MIELPVVVMSISSGNSKRLSNPEYNDKMIPTVTGTFTNGDSYKHLLPYCCKRFDRLTIITILMTILLLQPAVRLNDIGAIRFCNTVHASTTPIITSSVVPKRKVTTVLSLSTMYDFLSQHGTYRRRRNQHSQRQLHLQIREPNDIAQPNCELLLHSTIHRGGASTKATSSSSSSSSYSGSKSAKKKKSTKKKNKKKTSTSSKKQATVDGESSAATTNTLSPSKELINEKLKNEDSAAQALGDAIRRNAHLLLQKSTDDDSDMMLGNENNIIESIGYAIGSSDYTTSILKRAQQQQSDASANSNENVYDSMDSNLAQELTSPTAVIVQYFLKSHGGVHILQCICSLLASMAGLGSILIFNSSKQRHIQFILLQRTLLFGMCKHITGLLIASYMAARTIPTIGFQEAKQHIQTLIKDPISQYVFYTACVLLWLPPSSPTKPFATTTVGTKTNVEQVGDISLIPLLVWWQNYNWIPILLAGPVILREFISIALVISDVLTLIVATTTTTNDESTKYIARLLKVTHTIVDAGMSVLVTPKKWRSSSAVQRQAILAKLVSRISLTMEVGVGLLMFVDALVMTLQYLFINSSKQIRFFTLMKAMICTRLYIQFLLTRRKNITKLAQSIRGGAVELPLYVLNVILHPASSMGISMESLLSTTNTQQVQRKDMSTTNNDKNQWTWIDYIRIALDMDDQK